MYLVCVYLVMTSCDRDWRVYGVVPDSSFQTFKLKQKPKGTDKRQISSYGIRTVGLSTSNGNKRPVGHITHQYNNKNSCYSSNSFSQRMYRVIWFCANGSVKWKFEKKVYKIILIFYLERAWFSILPNVKSLFKGVLICAKYEEEF